MDPVTAVGLASAIISFVSLGHKVLKNAQEIRESIDSNTDRDRTRQLLVKQMQEASPKLKFPDQVRFVPEQRRLCELAVECDNLSQQMLDLLKKTKPKSQASFAIYLSALKKLSTESEIKDLEKRLDRCRNQLSLGLVDLLSQQSIADSARLCDLIKKDATKLEQLLGYVNQLREGVEIKQIGNEARAQLRRLIGLHDEALHMIYQQRILESLRFDGMHERDERVLEPHANTYEWIFKDDDSEHNEDDDSEYNEDDDSEYNEDDDSEYNEDDDSGHNEDDDSEYNEDDVEAPIHHGKIIECKQAREEPRRKFLTWLSSPSGIFHICGKLGSGKSTLMKFISTHQRTRAELRKWAGDKILVSANFFFWRPGSELQKSLNGLYRSLLYDILCACPALICDTLPELWKRAQQSPWQIQTKFDVPAGTIKAALESIIKAESLRSRLYKDHRFCFFIDGLDEYQEAQREDYVFLVKLLSSWVKDSQGSLKICVSSRNYNVFLNEFPVEQRLQLHELTQYDMQRYVQDALAHLPSERLKRHFYKAVPEKADGIFLWATLVVNDIRKKVEDDVSEEKLMRLLESLPPGLEELFRHILDGLDKSSQRTTFQTAALLKTAKTHVLPLSLLAFSFLDEYEKNHEFSMPEDLSALEHTTMIRNRTLSAYRKRLRGICGGLFEIHWGKEPWGVIEYTHRSIPDLLETEHIKQHAASILADFSSIDALSHLIFAQVQFENGYRSELAGHLCAGVSQMRLSTKVDSPPYEFLERLESWMGSHAFPDPAPGRELNVFSGWRTKLIPGYSTPAKGHAPEENIYSTLLLAGFEGYIDYVKWGVKDRLMVAGRPVEKALIASALLRPLFPPSSLDYFFGIGLFTDQSRHSFVAGWNLKFANAASHTIWQRFLVSQFPKWCINENFDAGWTCQMLERFLERGAATVFSVTVDNCDKVPEDIEFHFEDPEVSLSFEIYRMESLQHTELWYRPGDKYTMSLREWIEAMNPENKGRLFKLLDSAVGQETTGSDLSAENEERIGETKPGWIGLAQCVNGPAILYVVLPVSPGRRVTTEDGRRAKAKVLIVAAGVSFKRYLTPFTNMDSFGD